MRCILSFLVVLSLPLTAQQSVQRFPEGHALTTGYITGVLESRDGFMYVASQAGLRRYDGEEVVQLGPSFGGLAGSPHTLIESQDGNIWIGHHLGITRYDPARERYTNYNLPQDADLTAPHKGPLFRLAENDAGTTIYGLTEAGIVLFDQQDLRFRPLSSLRNQQDSLGTGHCTDIVRTPDGNFLLACAGGIFRLDDGNLQLSAGYTDTAHRLEGFALSPTPENGVLLGGREIIYRFVTDQTGGLQLVDSLDLAPGENADRSLCRDIVSLRQDQFYVATYRGLYQLRWTPGIRFDSTIIQATYRHEPDDDHSLSSDQLNHLALSSGGLLWIGTRKGLDRLPVGETPFNNFRRKPGELELCNDNVKGTAVDADNGILVVGTTTGVSLFNFRSETWTCYTPDNLPGFRSPYLINVDPGPEEHTFWLLYRKGGADLLDITNPEKPVVRPGIHPVGETDVTHAYEVAYRSDGTCYIATGRGIYVYDPLTGDSHWLQNDPADSTSLPDNYCYAVLVDDADQLWVGTRNKGLCRMYEGEAGTGFNSWMRDPDDPASLSSNLVLNLFEDKNRNLWVSTAGGISLWESPGKFRNFTSTDGLPHPLSYGIFADASDQLWSVQGGQITQIGLDNEDKFIVGAGFRQRDGMTDDFCTQYGWSSLPDGRLTISHPSGLSMFHPDSLRKDKYLPSVVLTDVQLFNQSVTIRGGIADTVNAFTLPVSPPRLQSLSLPPGQNFVSLSFAAPEHRPFHEVRYSWRMTGIQETWVDTDGRNYLSFPRLPPGDYLLELRSGGLHVGWSDQIRRLAIHMAAPWYQRWWAYMLFALGAAGIVFWGTRFAERQRQKVAAARLEEREELRRRSARDFHDEAGNHLSRVSLLTSLAERQLSAENNEEARTQVQGMLKEIGANTQVVREGMRDFIWALDPDNDNAGELALRLKRFGQELFAHHPGDFRAGPFSPDLSKLSLQADERRHLMLLFKEAMHNSLKHAPVATKLSLSIQQQANRLILDWTDDGPGYANTVGDDGMGMKSMRTRAAKIGADFDASGNNGCKITVNLPISPK
ncbi:sensor histidine kinase [Neolewinella persica]|uniref:sensor histidine kinase n=1 Tax=Neolewinella persica TaxID=70998 RepID=UPI000375B129|nr:sensor histidine kinase [Neolewinella persica]